MPSLWVFSICALFTAASAGPISVNATWPAVGMRFDPAHLARQLARNAEFRALIKNGTSLVTSNCDADMTSKITPCHQDCNQWCWAACGAMVENFYLGNSQCSNEECQLASAVSGGNCCPTSSSCSGGFQDPQNQCNHFSTTNILSAQLSRVIGRDFNGASGVLSQDGLDAALAAGNPVVLVLKWSPPHGGGHAVLIGGCSRGQYFVHDPWAWYPQMGMPTPPPWQSVNYEGLLTYKPNSQLSGKWADSAYSTESNN